MHGEPQLLARALGARVEAAMRAVVASNRFIEIVFAPGRHGLVGVLAAIGLAREDPVAEAGKKPRTHDGLDRRPADPYLAPAVRGGEIDAACRDLGLEDRRQRLRLLRHARAAPVELRRIEGREL